MYARIARFEGADPAVMEREIEGMREQIRRGMSGETSDDPSGQMSREQMESMQKMIKRVLVFVDREGGGSTMAVFTETEDEARKLDEMFSSMSPGDGGGRRTSADVYEVAIDEQTS